MPSRQLFSRVSHGKDSPERNTVRSDCESGSFQEGAKNLDCTYHFQAQSARCGQFQSLVFDCLGPIGKVEITSVLLILKDYTPSFLVTNIGIECVPPFCSR